MAGCAFFGAALLTLLNFSVLNLNHPLPPNIPDAGGSFFQTFQQNVALAIHTCWQTVAQHELEALLRLQEQATAEYQALIAPDSRTAERENAPLQILGERAEYGQVPEVLVDQNSLFGFPRPLQSSRRDSWMNLARRIKKHRAQLEAWLKDLPAQREVSRFYALFEHTSQLTYSMLYLDQWAPLLEEEWNLAAQTTQLPIRYRFLAQLQNGSAAISQPELEKFREASRPQSHRLPEHVQILPHTAPSGRIRLEIRITTDISDQRLIREFEGAIQTYWSAQSPIEITRVIWKYLPNNPNFTTLEEHLLRFPKNAAILTTGASTTRVHGGRAMILGPGTITPRILAHEVGHLLGLPDCYFRTLSFHPFRGVEIVEWENPFFPDELMCNSNEGFARHAQIQLERAVKTPAK